MAQQVFSVVLLSLCAAAAAAPGGNAVFGAGLLQKVCCHAARCRSNRVDERNDEQNSSATGTRYFELRCKWVDIQVMSHYVCSAVLLRDAAGKIIKGIAHIPGPGVIFADRVDPV